jgi:hypothetical protein
VETSYEATVVLSASCYGLRVKWYRTMFLMIMSMIFRVSVRYTCILHVWIGISRGVFARDDAQVGVL